MKWRQSEIISLKRHILPLIWIAQTDQVALNIYSSDAHAQLLSTIKQK